MKKFLVIIVAVIGFGLSAKAGPPPGSCRISDDPDKGTVMVSFDYFDTETGYAYFTASNDSNKDANFSFKFQMADGTGVWYNGGGYVKQSDTAPVKVYVPGLKGGNVDKMWVSDIVVQSAKCGK